MKIKLEAYKPQNYCLDCGKQLINGYAKRCKSCNGKYLFKIGKIGGNDKNAPNYRGGLPRCIDCNKELSTRGTQDYIPKRCQKCANKNQVGKWKKKLIRNCIDCGKKLGKGSCYEGSKRCSSCAKKGKLSPFWRGGLSYIFYPSKFNKKLKYKIFKRDKFICQKCYTYPCNNLTAHHIDYNRKNCKKNNLITLCFKCNLKVNANRDYWYAYFTYIMENNDERKVN
jgi:phage FluMu protein Com